MCLTHIDLENLFLDKSFGMRLEIGSIPIFVDLDIEGSTLRIIHPYPHSYPLRLIKRGDSMEEEGENSCGWIVWLLWWIEEWGWRQGRSKSSYVKLLYVSFLIINEKTYAFPLNFVYECLSVFHSSLCYFELFDLVKRLCCFFVIAGPNQWSGGHLHGMNGALRNERHTESKGYRLVPFPPFIIQFNSEFESGRIDSLPFHLPRVLRKRLEEIKVL